MQDIFTFLRQYDLPAPQSVIQVGASVGQEMPLFLNAGVKKGVFIEPLPQPFQMLEKVCAPHKNFIPVNMLACGLDAQEHKFHVASNFGQSSSIKKPTRHTQVYPTVTFDETVNMQGYRLDTIVKAAATKFFKGDTQFDLLFVDVQGAELEVFKGAAETLSKVRYIYTEVTYGTDYEGAVTYSEVDCYLRMHGFVCSSLEIDPNFLAHGNAIFVKRPSP
jgi:FkbM family methyltransferase